MRQQQNNAQVKSAGYKPAIIILTNLMERAKKEAIREKEKGKGLGEKKTQRSKPYEKIKKPWRRVEGAVEEKGGGTVSDRGLRKGNN